MENTEKREHSEINFYRDDEHERPESDSVCNLINKMGDCAVFLSVIERYESVFSGAQKVLELGGGQGWASGALKKQFPHLSVTLSDISEFAVASRHKWERILDIAIDNAYACRAYDIPEDPAQFDVVFCFAAAHHFTKMGDSLREIYRVLKKGGHCFFFHEPSTSPLFYKQAYKRVNKKRPVVPEDVLVYPTILREARKNGFSATVAFNPTLIKRGPVETIYYFILAKFPFLQKLLPCTANYRFIK
jgi:ubiquinone/menaquinone biosynthesis C-methylase UbiE